MSLLYFTKNTTVVSHSNVLNYQIVEVLKICGICYKEKKKKKVLQSVFYDDLSL